MAVSNGKGNGAVSHLDKLLESKPPEFQNKVLRFALDSGMKPDDPAFRLVQYIGYLAQLTETAPADWKLLFENLQVELNEWTQLTAEQLKTQADHSENIKNLATSCNQLGTALSALNLTSQQQLELLTNLTKLLGSWQNTSRPEMLVEPLRSELREIKNMILSQQINQNADGDLGVKGWLKAFQTALSFMVPFFILFWLTWAIFPPRTPSDTMGYIQEIWERSGWTNTKLQRVEKHLGTEPRKR
jgi:hypothetical protein